MVVLRGRGGMDSYKAAVMGCLQDFITTVYIFRNFNVLSFQCCGPTSLRSSVYLCLLLVTSKCESERVMIVVIVYQVMF